MDCLTVSESKQKESNWCDGVKFDSWVESKQSSDIQHDTHMPSYYIKYFLDSQE